MKLQIEKHNTADNRGQKYLSADKIKQATKIRLKTMPQKRLYIDKINKQGVKKMKKKTLSILISVLMTLCLLFCFTGCRDKVIYVRIYAKDPVNGKEIKEIWGYEAHLEYTGSKIDIRDVFDIKVVKESNGKTIKFAQPIIRSYFLSSEGNYQSFVNQKGKYYVEIEWNRQDEVLNYSSALMDFYLYVE